MNDPAQEILTNAFRNSYAELRFPEMQINLNQVIEGTCYQAILEIKKFSLTLLCGITTVFVPSKKSYEFWNPTVSAVRAAMILDNTFQ